MVEFPLVGSEFLVSTPGDRDLILLLAGVPRSVQPAWIRAFGASAQDSRVGLVLASSSSEASARKDSESWQASLLDSRSLLARPLSGGAPLVPRPNKRLQLTAHSPLQMW